jgi:hypothetical protein
VDKETTDQIKGAEGLSEFDIQIATGIRVAIADTGDPAMQAFGISFKLEDGTYSPMYAMSDSNAVEVSDQIKRAVTAGILRMMGKIIMPKSTDSTFDA